MNQFNRREALTGLASIGAMGIASTAIAAGAQPLKREPRISQEQLGYDPASKEYTLPPLPYEYDALEPVIDEQTMRIHHDKHHAGYIRGANAALKQLEMIRWGTGDPALIQHWERQLSFHMGGHINHTLFWSGMKPESEGGGGIPSGNLRQQIENDFGSFSKFSDQFTLAATKVEGSGWGWLIYEPVSRRLMIVQMQNQQQMMFSGAIPLLGIDVWEHAYYLKYQNRRGDYAKAFMRVIDWDEIARRFSAARS